MALVGSRAFAKNMQWSFHGIRREMEKYLVVLQDIGQGIRPRILPG
jgi:hypothetical protein